MNTELIILKDLKFTVYLIVLAINNGMEYYYRKDYAVCTDKAIANEIISLLGHKPLEWFKKEKLIDKDDYTVSVTALTLTVNNHEAIIKKLTK